MFLYSFGRVGSWICKRTFNNSMGQLTNAMTEPAKDPEIITRSRGRSLPGTVRISRNTPLAVNKTALLRLVK
jgi:hypothetical protein